MFLAPSFTPSPSIPDDFWSDKVVSVARKPLPSFSGKALVLGDLHLGSSLCSYLQYREEVLRRIRNVDAVFLTGDCLDLLTNHRDPRTIIDAVREPYEEILAQGKPVLHVLGNHEEHREGFRYLVDAALSFPNLFIEPNAVLVNSTLIHHGDRRLRDLHQTECLTGRDKDELSLALYKAGSRLGVSGPIARVLHPPRQTCIRLATFLAEHFPELWAQCDRVITGHTHVSIDGVKVDGRVFYNGGATLLGVRPRFLELGV